jgi:hypothetical protein
MKTIARRLALTLAVGLLAACCTTATGQTITKSQAFDHDPGWDQHNNHIVPKHYPTVVQDFGYSPTNCAGNQSGELGGLVTRAYEPAYYGDKIDPRTLEDKLTASGSFAITATEGGAGQFFGWFRASQPGGVGRPINSLGLHIDGEKHGARLAVRMINANNRSCGTFITPFIPGKFRPTPLKNDGTRYAWTMTYDPGGAGGQGQVTFTLHGKAPLPEEYDRADLPPAHLAEARRRFPIATSFHFDLPPGFKQEGATFDHFGLMNMQKSGAPMRIYYDDLSYDGRKQDFARDPGWDGDNNRVEYTASDVGGAQNFGYSDTNHAGGHRGEAGGVFWRAESNWGYYADRVGPLSLDQRLEASGKVVLVAGAPDADMALGWFRASNDDPPANRTNFVGVQVGGPTRVGHYFAPAFANGPQPHRLQHPAPLLKPGQPYDWQLVYDPEANAGAGSIRVTLGGKSATLDLKPGDKTAGDGHPLDHFGLFSIYPGGQIVRLFIDDVKYTAAKSK